MKPEGPLQDAADEAMRVFEEHVTAAGGTVDVIFITAGVHDVPPGGITAGSGFNDSGELLAFLLTQAKGVAEANGLDLRLVPIGDVGHG
jgi:hypothetical protein